MPIFNEGTISVTNGSNSVTGTSNSFGADSKVGDVLLVNNAGSFYLHEVERILGPTKVNLSKRYSGPTDASASYYLIRNFTNSTNFDLMKKIEEFLTLRQKALVEMQDWMAGSVGGGPNGDGLYPLTDRYGSVTMTKSMAKVISELEAALTNAANQATETTSKLNQVNQLLSDIGDMTAFVNEAKTARDQAASSASSASDDAAEVATNTQTVTTKAGEVAAHATQVANHASDVSSKATDIANHASDVTAKAGQVSTNAQTVATKTAEVSADADQVAIDKQAASDSATQASSSAASANQAKTEALDAKNVTVSAKNEVQQWIYHTVDSEFAPGKYSALHYHTKVAALAAQVAQQASAITGGIAMAGQWDASAGAPPAPENGSVMYRVSVAGSIGLDSYEPGDNIVYDPNNEVWFKQDNTERFTSINGQTSGSVSITFSSIGALGANQTAVDSQKLNGQSASYYLDWENLTNVPATFAPSSHAHAMSEVTGLSDELERIELMALSAASLAF